LIAKKVGLEKRTIRKYRARAMDANGDSLYHDRIALRLASFAKKLIRGADTLDRKLVAERRRHPMRERQRLETDDIILEEGDWSVDE